MGIIMKEFTPKNIKKDKAVISIRIEAELLDVVDKLSVKSDISRNEFIIQCINYAITNMNK